MKYQFNFRFNLSVVALIICILTACQKRTNEDVSTDLQDTLTSAKHHDMIPATISEIQSAYAATIQKASRGSLDSLSFKYSCRNETSGSISYFSEAGNLKMIVHRYNEYDHYSAVDRYFISDSTVYFAYRRSVAWSFESGPEGATKDDITEQRVYIANGSPVQCLEKKYTIRSHAQDNPEPDRVANAKVNCTVAEQVIASYKSLQKFRSAPKGCPDE